MVLDALNASPYANNTIVIFLGDHGVRWARANAACTWAVGRVVPTALASQWQLGDLGEFGKKTNFERATRAPLIVQVPPTMRERKQKAIRCPPCPPHPELVSLAVVRARCTCTGVRA